MNIKLIEEFLRKHEERNLAMLQASKLLGFDITFSKEEILKEVEQDIIKHMEKAILKEVTIWMK